MLKVIRVGTICPYSPAHIPNALECVPRKGDDIFSRSDFRTQNCFSSVPHLRIVNEDDNVQFQKISIAPPWRELEIPKGRGGQRPRKFQRGGGLYDRVSFQRDSRGPLIQYGFECRSSCSKILSYLLVVELSHEK